MKEVVTSITQRGQVTIPAEVRRMLGVKPRDKVAFKIEDNEVKLVKVEFTLESAYGSVKPLERPEDFEELSRIAKEEKASRMGREMQ